MLVRPCLQDLAACGHSGDLPAASQGDSIADCSRLYWCEIFVGVDFSND